MKQQQKYVYETWQEVTLRLSHVSRIIRLSFNCFQNFELQLSILVARSILYKQKCFPKTISTSRDVTKISNCRVFVVSSRGSRKQSLSPFPPPPLLPQEDFEVQLLALSKGHYRPQKAIFIKSTVIISRFMMITSLLKKTTTFWETKIISLYFTWRLVGGFF